MQLFTENSQPIRAETRIHAWVGCCFIIRLVSLNSTWNSTLSTNLLNNNGITNGEHMLERPCFGTLSVLLLAATSTPTCQVVADVWHCNDTCTRHMLSSAAVLITVTACCTVSVTVCWRNYKPFRMQLLGSWREQKVRPHHDGASWSSLASSPPENQVQTGYDSLLVPARISADIPGWRLSGNLRHRRQETFLVRSH